MNTKQINHISVFQTSKVLAMITFVMMAIWMIFVAIMGFFTGVFPMGDFGEFFLRALVMLVVAPFFAFIGHAIMFWFYNIVASMVGGIEVELKDTK